MWSFDPFLHHFGFRLDLYKEIVLAKQVWQCNQSHLEYVEYT